MVYKSVQKGKTTKTTKLVSLISSKHNARTDPHTYTHTVYKTMIMLKAYEAF